MSAGRQPDIAMLAAAVARPDPPSRGRPLIHRHRCRTGAPAQERLSARHQSPPHAHPVHRGACLGVRYRRAGTGTTTRQRARAVAAWLDRPV